MRFFLCTALLGSFMLIHSMPGKLDGPKKPALPDFFSNRHAQFKDSFKAPQNANVLWAFITGQKQGIGPALRADFKTLELGFLLSPSGLHLSGLLCLLFWPIKKRKRLKKRLSLLMTCLCYFLPFYTIKRIVLFRLLSFLSRFLKKRPAPEILFYLTFTLSFMLGHYRISPLGFSLSFLFMGCFMALRDYSRPILLLGLFSIHLLVALFLNQEVSYLSLWISIPLLALFSVIIPLGYLYFLSFKILNLNWIEWPVRTSIVLTHWGAKLAKGFLINSSVFLVLAVWLIMLRKNKLAITVLLLLHSNCVYGPSLFSGHHYT